MKHQSNNNPVYAAFVSPGMPALKVDGRTFSIFEFWPTWLMYLPVIMYWLMLSIKHRSFTLPLLANPCLPLSGMVGIAKSELMAQATGDGEKAILPWLTLQPGSITANERLPFCLAKMAEKSLSFPVVCKPDIGCRGTGVKLIHNRSELNHYLDNFPSNADVMIQQLAQWEAEAGIFYVKKPGQKAGTIVSIALKYMPYVVGDGKHTLAELIALDPRASKKQNLYLERHKHKLSIIIPDGEPYRLIFSASHCSGAIFRDARDIITPQLSQRIDSLMADIPEFYYGRLDVKFSSLEALRDGKDIEIVEINTASSESLHIWDKETKLLDAVGALLWQYRTLFEIGKLNRQRGYKAPTLGLLLRHWRLERKLSAQYPAND